MVSARTAVPMAMLVIVLGGVAKCDTVEPGDMHVSREYPNSCEWVFHATVRNVETVERQDALFTIVFIDKGTAVYMDAWEAAEVKAGSIRRQRDRAPSNAVIVNRTERGRCSTTDDVLCRWVNSEVVGIGIVDGSKKYIWLRLGRQSEVHGLMMESLQRF